MDLISLLSLALALSADAFAVALAQGAVARRVLTTAIRVGLAFGFAQFLMPLAGALLGRALAGYLEAIDHWVAFGLLAFVGGKMILEGVRGDPPGDDDTPEREATNAALALLAVATSIDAGAAGLSLAAMGVAPLAPAVLIGVVTFAASAAAVAIGRQVGTALGRHAEIAGGLALLAIGVKVLIDHHALG